MREMKDSGISWIPKIPINWSIHRLKYIVDSLSKGNGITKEDVLLNGDTPCVRYGEIYSKYDYSFTTCISRTNVDKVSSPQYFSYGDILFAGTGELIEEIGMNIVYLGDYDCLAGGDIIIARHQQNPAFLNYALNSGYIQSQKGFGKAKLKVVHISAFDLGNLIVALPPITEQKLIADYLDSKCAEFNSTLSDIQSQIEALEEYKRSVITEVVTKGLDPDVEMRDSGIAWVGDIPAHWITHPLYFYFGERKNKNALGLETNLLSLSYGKIIRKDINSNGGLLPESFNTYNIIEKDDIIIRPTDLQNDKRSLRTGIAREHGIITSAYIAMKAIKTVNPEYFHYLLHAYDVMKVFYNMGNGVRQGLNFSEFSRLMVFEPAIEEQNAIVSYLKEKCDEIDLAIAEKKQQIETIEEYKKSLIFEYVTGKKEVIV